MNQREDALKLHRDNQGKYEIKSKVRLEGPGDLSLAYTPGVAEPCREIYQEAWKVYQYTTKGNMVAVITDGSAVLGLGDIGPEAALPVMEGKAILFKQFGGLDAIPICLKGREVGTLVENIKALTPAFGGINLEDISAPRCFSIEERLKKEAEIPVFHDDQHGTAIVVTAGIFNFVKITQRKLDRLKVVINGAGAAGIAVVKLLLYLGVKEITLCDSAGIIFPGRGRDMNPYKEEVARLTRPSGGGGTLGDALVGADIFIGVSAAGVLKGQMVRTMNGRPAVFALANPVPEIMPSQAREAGALVVATGRSDFPNQVNNVLAFPGVLRGAMESWAADINDEMKVRSAWAIAGLLQDHQLTPDNIIPGVFDRRVAPRVAAAVVQAAQESGLARREVSPGEVEAKTRILVERAWKQ